MRLVTLRLQNFRQHVDTRIEFQRGLTGVIGPNGAGKSTILEAIAWAIYGASAARGTNDTIRFSRAPGRARVLVDLAFELGGHEFRVTRTLNSADVFLDHGVTPVATGTSGATSYLQSKVGMTRDEFFNTYFTTQKELQFLAQLGPKDRGRFLAQVLGYERLRRAQDRATQRRKVLHAEIIAVREVLPDPDKLRAEREAAEAQVKDARAAVATTEKQFEKRRTELDALKPRWEEVQQKREKMKELGHEIDAARRDGEAAQREIERARTELDRIEGAQAELQPLQTQLIELEPIAKDCEKFAQLARLAERRRALEDTRRDLKADLDSSAKRLKELEPAPLLMQQLSGEQHELKEQLAAATESVGKLKEEWTSERQDVRTKLAQQIAGYNELKDKIEQLRNAGPDGTCPICTRPLGKEFDKVLAVLEDEFEAIQQDGKWLRKREKQLATKPEPLTTAEEVLAAQQKASEAAAARIARCEQAVQEIWTLTNDRQREDHRLAEVQVELDQIPAGYDADAHKRADTRLKQLREVEQRATRLLQIVEARAVRQQELEEATERARDALARLEAGVARLEEIAYEPQLFEQLRVEFERARTAVHEAELVLRESRARLDAVTAAHAGVKRREKEAEENQAKLRELELDHRHHQELDGALTLLRAELNARVRPELGDLASIFLNEITDGRYTALEIDENYNVLVLDEGEEKPVISGGEEDIANLVLRIAISQMIAERAGQQLSALFLDEVFGSLDLERRDNVIQLLHRLGDRFEQVILITHIETIREGLDHVIRVGYDERTGASVVGEESVQQGVLSLVE